ncbi:uncharacterized protein FRV6_11781 [Fusarium oxysporum]|uniref:Uncharacterized protein n=1 Tax=Fusarium oxysporum TaxID=5507 RepID=A0A2H3TG18_FUSOX|nr:uncharacterized protein FRV6_11781 [Fusarium oxysporum]
MSGISQLIRAPSGQALDLDYSTTTPKRRTISGGDPLIFLAPPLPSLSPEAGWRCSGLPQILFGWVLPMHTKHEVSGWSPQEW